MLTKMRNVGGEVYLTAPSEHVKKLLIITKLNNIFTVFDSVDDFKCEKLIRSPLQWLFLFLDYSKI